MLNVRFFPYLTIRILLLLFFFLIYVEVKKQINDINCTETLKRHLFCKKKNCYTTSLNMKGMEYEIRSHQLY